MHIVSAKTYNVIYGDTDSLMIYPNIKREIKVGKDP